MKTVNTKNILPKLVKLKENYKITISKELEKKIIESCKLNWNVEWSGVLFYNTKNTFGEKDFEVIAIDYYPMDIGSASYTEFTESPEIAGYMADNPELLTSNMGLIHSHNNMNTFFSSTDTSTLQEEGYYRNHFVSLIVNNEGDYSAAITSKVTEKISQVSKSIINTFNNTPMEIETVDEIEDEYIAYNILNIYKEVDNEESILQKRFEEIKANKKRKEEEEAKKRQQRAVKGYSNYGSHGTYVPPAYFGLSNYPDDLHSGYQRDLFMNTKYQPLASNKKDVTVEQQLINNTVLRIITGSILVEDTNKLDLDKWVQSKMVPTYTKRFGDIDKEPEKFSYWVDLLIEYIILNDCQEDDLLDDESISIFALEIIAALESFKQNKFLKVIIKQVKKYV